MRYLRTNTACRVTVGPFFDRTDGITPETALTATNEKITLMVDDANVPTLVIDANATASGGNNDFVHVTGDDAGFYDLELTAAQTNYLGRAMLAITYATDHCPVFHEFMILPAMIYDSLVLGTDRLDTNVTHIGDTSQTARDIGASVLLSSGTGTGQVTLTSGRVNADMTHIAGTAYASTTLFTLASHDPGATIGTSTLTQTQVTGGAYALNSASFAFNAALDFTTTQKAATLARVTLVDTLTTYTSNTPQTGDTYALANGSAGFVAIDTVVDAIKTKTDSLTFTVAGDVDVNVQTWGGTAISTPPAVNATQFSGSATAADNAEVVFATDFAANYDTTNDMWRSNVAAIAGDTAVSGIVAMGVAYDNDGYIGANLLRINGTSIAGTSTQVAAAFLAQYNVATPVFTNESVNLTSTVAGRIDVALSTLATAANLATVAGYLDTEVAAILEDTGTTIPAQISALNNISTAQVNAEVDTALADYDPPTRAEATSDVNSVLAVLNGLVLARGTIGATGNTTTALHLNGLTYGDDEINNYLLVIYDVSTSEYHSRWVEDWAISSELATVATLPFTPQDSTDTYWLLPVRQDVTGGSGLDAAGVRAAIGMASANLDTQLDALPTAAEIRAEIDSNSTQLAAIVADTNELQTDWTNGGRLDLIVDAILVDTGTTLQGDITAILADTNELQTNQGNWLTATGFATAASLATAQADLDILTGTDGVTLATSQPNYAPATSAQAVAIQGATFDTATDSLEAIRNRGDSAWDTATGFSTHSAADVVTALGTGSTLTALATQTSVDDLPTNSELAAALGTADDAVLAAITSAHAATDGLIGDLPTNAELATALDAIPTAAENAAGLLDLAAGVETGLTLRQALRLIAAAAAGKISGAATTTITIRNAVADSKDRITATVTEDGDRSAITVDLT